MKRLLPMILLLLSHSGIAAAQMKVVTIHFHVLNGRSGKPVKYAHATVNVYPLSKDETPTKFTTDSVGNFSMLVLGTAQVSTRMEGHRPCERIAKADRKKPARRFSVEQIVSSGVLSPNDCSSRSASPTPDVLTLYVRPAHRW